MPLLLPLLFASLLSACRPPPVYDSGSPSDGFCESMADAGSSVLDEGGATGANGTLFARILTDESEDLHNPQYVANVTYVLKNLDVGGSPRYGESDFYGEISSTLGEGNWNIQLSSSNAAGYVCANTQDFEIVAGYTTRLCLDVGCE